MSTDGPMNSDGPPATDLTTLLDGFFAGQVLMVGTRLKLYTKCAETPQDATTLAGRCEVQPAWMAVLLDANVALGLLESTPAGYAPTPLARAYLNEQKHGALTNLVKFALSDEAPAWADLADLMRGRAAPPPFADEERTISTTARAYGKVAYNILLADAQRCGDFSDVQRAVEIGHGLAPLGLAVLKQSATAQLTVVNWPSYETALNKTLTHAGYRARTTFIGGDPVEATPQDAQADVALFAGVLSRSPADRRLPLLRAAAGTLRPGGLLHMQELVQRAGAPSRAEALARLRAAVLFGPEGLTPLEPEGLLDLLRQAGFTNGVLLPIPESHATCITARRGA